MGLTGSFVVTVGELVIDLIIKKFTIKDKKLSQIEMGDISDV